MDVMLELENVSKTYRGYGEPVRALDEVTLRVAPGEFVAVQGASGSGKSTLLMIAGGLLAPSTGEVRIGEARPYALGADARSKLRSRSIGFVFQQFHLVPSLSVLENVLAPSLANGDHRRAEERAEQLIQRFQLHHRSRHLPYALSSGERQRTALARALLNDPKLVLADEPTGNLDEENRDLVLAFLRQVAAEGTAVLLVTHDAEAARQADRSVRLDEGRLVPASS